MTFEEIQNNDQTSYKLIYVKIKKEILFMLKSIQGNNSYWQGRFGTSNLCLFSYYARHDTIYQKIDLQPDGTLTITEFEEFKPYTPLN